MNKFITLTGHQWQSTPFLMSQFAQAKVTPEQLEIIKTAAKEAGDLQRKLMAEADVKHKGESYGDFVTEVLAAAGSA